MYVCMYMYIYVYTYVCVFVCVCASNTLLFTCAHMKYIYTFTTQGWQFPFE